MRSEHRLILESSSLKIERNVILDKGDLYERTDQRR